MTKYVVLDGGNGKGWDVETLEVPGTVARLVARFECREDAQLFSAAPALLEALERIAFEPQGPSDASHAEVLQAVTDIARAAITLATEKCVS